MIQQFLLPISPLSEGDRVIVRGVECIYYEPYNAGYGDLHLVDVCKGTRWAVKLHEIERFEDATLSPF